METIYTPNYILIDVKIYLLLAFVRMTFLPFTKPNIMNKVNAQSFSFHMAGLLRVHLALNSALCGWMDVLGFNTTVTAKVIIMAVGDAHVFSDFLTPVVKQLSFQSHQLLFSHASALVRGRNKPERKFDSTEYQSQPPGQESARLTTEPSLRGPWHFMHLTSDLVVAGLILG